MEVSTEKNIAIINFLLHKLPYRFKSVGTAEQECGATQSLTECDNFTKMRSMLIRSYWSHMSRGAARSAHTMTIFLDKLIHSPTSSDSPFMCPLYG